MYWPQNWNSFAGLILLLLEYLAFQLLNIMLFNKLVQHYSLRLVNYEPSQVWIYSWVWKYWKRFTILKVCCTKIMHKCFEKDYQYFLKSFEIKKNICENICNCSGIVKNLVTVPRPWPPNNAKYSPLFSNLKISNPIV